MTLVRRLALGISSRVVRWASPGCKEWAEGLEREAAVIESDWAALRWSIGSTRVLLDRREAPMTSLDDAYAIAQKFFEKRKKENSYFFWTCVVLSALSVALFCVPTNFIGRIGDGLVSGGLLFSLYRMHVYRSFVVRHPSGLKDRVANYRSELQRYIKFNYGWASLLNVALTLSGLLVISYVYSVQISGAFTIADYASDNSFYIAISFPIALMIYMNLHERQRQIAELDALLAERDGVSAL